MEIKDNFGKLIKDGQTLELLEDIKAALKGTQYRAEIYKWNEEDEVESVVAKSDFLTMRLNEEAASKFIIV